jgi:hypothetical protein
MIDIAAATNGVKILGRKATRAEIIMFKTHLTKHKEKLNSDAVSGMINTTCDGWQAENVNAYFAVTGHWIEAKTDTHWECKSTRLGFTQVNNLHNGVTCGNATNNGTMLKEFVLLYEVRCNKECPW